MASTTRRTTTTAHETRAARGRRTASSPGTGLHRDRSERRVLTRPLKTSEQVARDVVHDIIAQGLRPGQSLPPEAAMLEHYGVSRESLREGLRLLEVQGLITIRRGPGGGPVVGTVDPANLGRVSTLYFHMAGATYKELFDVWMMAESILAERAARNRDIDARTAAMAPYLEEEPVNVHSAPAAVEAFVRAHTLFHCAVASLVDNRVLELTMQTMGQIVSHHVAIEADPRELRGVLEQDHLKIARAIVAGHANRARSLMDEHIAGVARLNAERLGPKMDELIEWH